MHLPGAAALLRTGLVPLPLYEPAINLLGDAACMCTCNCDVHPSDAATVLCVCLVLLHCAATGAGAVLCILMVLLSRCHLLHASTVLCCHYAVHLTGSASTPCTCLMVLRYGGIGVAARCAQGCVHVRMPVTSY